MMDMSNTALDEYQVVRQEFYNCQNEPLLTFKKGRVYVNSYTLSIFPDKDYIQILVNPDKKTLIIRPVADKIKDSYAWAGGRKKRNPRHISCGPLFAMIFQMMGWDISARYRITGTLQKNTNMSEELLFFDLNNAVCFVTEDTDMEKDSEQDLKRDTEGFARSTDSSDNRKKTRTKVTEYYPRSWEGSFGVASEKYTDKLIKTYEEDNTFSVELPFNHKNNEKMYRAVLNIEDKDEK